MVLELILTLVTKMGTKKEPTFLKHRLSNFAISPTQSRYCAIFEGVAGLRRRVCPVGERCGWAWAVLQWVLTWGGATLGTKRRLLMWRQGRLRARFRRLGWMNDFGVFVRKNRIDETRW